MKKIKIILLTLLLMIMTTNVIAADSSASINIDSEGNITFDIPTDIPYDDLFDLDKYLTMVSINDDVDTITTINCYSNLSDLPTSLYGNEVTFTIKIFDVETEEDCYDLSAEPEYGTYVVPTFLLVDNADNDYVFVLDGTPVIDTVEITGNEIDTKIVLDNTKIKQNGNVIKIGRDVIKDFSPLYDLANISFIENGNTIQTLTDVKLNSDDLKNTISDIKFNITHDSNNFYLSIDNSTYTNGISFIHVYAVEGLTKSIGYTIGEHKAYGDDPQAYDLTSTDSIISLIDSEDLDSLMSTTSPIAIPIPDFAKDHRKIAVDVYSDGYVTAHNLYTIPKPNPPKSVDKDEEIEVIETVQTYVAPNTSVR